MTETRPTPAKDKFNLDSTYFVAFEMAHETLRQGLADRKSVV